MTKSFKRAALASALFIGLGVAGQASAQSTWDLSLSTCDPAGSAPSTAGCTISGVTATVEAWSNTDMGGKFKRANITDQSTSGVGATGVSSGGTLEITGSNNHAFDNAGEPNGSSTYVGGTVEMALVKFSEAMNLSAAAIGWRSGDADMSILRWAGDASGPTLTGMTATGTTGLVESGWDLVSSADAYASYNIASNTALYSSWWLISTYFGGTADSTSGDLSLGNDYFKLKTFSAQVCAPGNSVDGSGVCGGGGGSVPEPGSLALAGLALVGIVASRRPRRAVRQSL